MSKKNDQGKKGSHGAQPGDAPAASATGGGSAETASISREDYDAQLHILQVELVKPSDRERGLRVHAGVHRCQAACSLNR